MSWRGRATRSTKPSSPTMRNAPSWKHCSRRWRRPRDSIKAACPSELPATPPDRLAAIGKRLQAMLQGVATVQPALADFYNSLVRRAESALQHHGQATVRGEPRIDLLPEYAPTSPLRGEVTDAIGVNRTFRGHCDNNTYRCASAWGPDK